MVKVLSCCGSNSLPSPLKPCLSAKSNKLLEVPGVFHLNVAAFTGKSKINPKHVAVSAQKLFTNDTISLPP